MVHGMADSLFLSTPSARRATHQTGGRLCSKSISIHALREEGDTPFQLGSILTEDFYPRPPRGGRQEHERRHQTVMLFLSTPSARRATHYICTMEDETGISIHALREEGDLLPGCSRSAGRAFLSTPSARRATPSSQPPSCADCYFYPRPPRGGRRLLASVKTVVWRFLSTPSARRATSLPKAVVKDREISIHALREEGDACLPGKNTFTSRFLSTPSARRATGHDRTGRHRPAISIHALREEGDSGRRC